MATTKKPPLGVDLYHRDELPILYNPATGSIATINTVTGEDLFMAKKRKTVKKKLPAKKNTVVGALRKENARLIQEVSKREATIISLSRALEQSDALLLQQTEKFAWRTAEGEVIEPKNMEESHLRNTVCYLQRHLVAAFGTVRYLQSTAYKVQALHEMLKEAKWRGIDV